VLLILQGMALEGRALNAEFTTRVLTALKTFKL
jgi:hypothetical protein